MEMNRNSQNVGALVGLCLILVACGGRTTVVPGDGDGGAKADQGAMPAKCSSLGLSGKAIVEYSDNMKLSPLVRFDGQRFATVWHTQPAYISSLNGELRLARVDVSGHADSKDGIPLGQNNASFVHALSASAGELTLVQMAGSGVKRRIMDLKGVDKNIAEIKGAYIRAAITHHPTGHALLLAEHGGIPRIAVVHRSGAVSTAASLVTAQIMASVWLAPRQGGGWAAMLHSTNANGTLYLLDANFKVLGQNGMGHGAMVRSVSPVVLPGGFAALYNTSSNKAELELYDASGKDRRRVVVGDVPASLPLIGQTALVWTGEQLVATYPSKVSGQYLLRLLDREGKLLTQAAKLPNCLAVTASQISAAWGKGHLAVASVNAASGVAKSGVCVVVMKCL